MIVADDPTTIRDLRARLERLGHELVSVTSAGDELPALVHSAKPEVVVASDHFERELEALAADSPVPTVLLRSTSEASLRSQRMRNGPHRYLQTPVDDQTLAMAIELVLASASRFESAEAQGPLQSKVELWRALRSGPEADELLANVGHELRTPLNAILGMSEVLLDTPLTPWQRESLRTVRASAEDLFVVIADLLDLTTIETGTLVLEPSRFHVRSTVEDVLRALVLRAYRKGLECRYQVDENVPDSLIGDSARLRQVLVNVLGNAIKFTDKGKVLLEVSLVETVSDRAVLSFTVHDTGIGIEAHQHGMIFDAFTQGDRSTTRAHGGTGLGLAVSAHLVRLMGGRMEVDSVLGRGSTFRFTTQFAVEKAASEAVSGAPFFLSGVRALIVDEDHERRLLLERWCAQWQVATTAVTTEVAAIDALWHAATRATPFDLVLVLLDSGTTHALVSRIRDRAELSGSHVILFTSGERGDQRARSLKIDAELLKPVAQEELFRALQNVARRNAKPAPGPHPILHADGQAAPPTSLTVLVAEDNEFTALLLEQLLSRRGHRVQLVADGGDALVALAGASFDLLLLDLYLPELDGFEVVERIRTRERRSGGHLPVIAITGQAKVADRQRCLAAGVDDYLTKPVHARELWASIERLTFDASGALRAPP